MNKTLVSISVAVIACTIGVTTQLAGFAEAQDMDGQKQSQSLATQPFLDGKVRMAKITASCSIKIKSIRLPNRKQ